MKKNVSKVIMEKKEGNIDIFKENLKISRINAGFSQDDLADKIGVNRATISFYEKGKRKPDIEMFIKIANALNVSCDYLLGYSNSPTREHHETKEITGLSGKAIKELQTLAIEANKNTEKIDCFNEICKLDHYTINYLLENNSKYHFFNDLGNFLFFKERNKELIELNQPIVNDDLGYTMTIKQWETSFKITTDEKLFNIKDDIEQEAENATKNNKKKK
jgi:DNA-binding helix-turn-helix protein